METSTALTSESHHKNKRPRKSIPGLLPKDITTEKNVVGCLIPSPRLIFKYDMTPEMFYETRNQIIYKTIIEMLVKKLPIGDLEIWEYLREKGLREELNNLCPGGSLLNYLGNLVYQSIQGSTAHEVGKLKEVAQKRRLWRQAYRVMKEIEREAALYGNRT